MNITRLLLLFFLITVCFEIPAQNHFQAVGNFTDAMNINVLDAKVNGIDLEPGDEIGIFSGTLCVGSTTLTESLEDVLDTKSKSAVAGSDDAETSEIDGFIAGDSILFKFWDTSVQEEVIVDQIRFYNPVNGSETAPKTFQIGATAYVSLNSTFNYKPKSDAGTDQIINEGEPGQLDGTGSTDLNQDSLIFTWIDVDSLGLVDLKVKSPAFTAPKITADKIFRIVLVVSDGKKSSEPDTVIVKVLNVPAAPVANAGNEVRANEMDLVILDGSLSSDVDGLSLSYKWRLSVSEISISNSDSVIAKFTAPKVESDTIIYAVLTVKNTTGLTDNDTVFIHVSNVNSAPVAIAGENVIIDEGTEYMLNGMSSYDPDGDTLSFEWSSDFLILDDNSSSMPRFVANEIERDTSVFVTLKVSDNELWSETDTVWIRIHQVNKIPEWINLPNDTAFVGRSYFGIIRVFDVDMYDTVQISISDLPTWLKLFDNGDGTAKLIADTIPSVDAFLGKWEFTVHASDGHSEIDSTFNLFITFFTGTGQPELAGFMVFPNPAKDWVTIRTNPPLTSKTTFRIYDLVGNLIRQDVINQQVTNYNLSDLNRGVYLFELLQDGHPREVIRILLN